MIKFDFCLISRLISEIYKCKILRGQCVPLAHFADKIRRMKRPKHKRFVRFLYLIYEQILKGFTDEASRNVRMI